MRRVVCWFSCGAASAAATKLALDDYRSGRVQADELVIARIRIAEEHPDNDRFAKDCEEWFNAPIITIRNEKYEGSIVKVFETKKYMAGIRGAPCTQLLKKQVRKDFEKPNDLNVFSYTIEERSRLSRFQANPFAPKVWPVLIEKGWSKSTCLGFLIHVGIELPAMYRLGYRNNNCIGCVKGGAGYWNSIRRDFPEAFAQRVEQSRRLGARLVSHKGKRIFLDELPEGYRRITYPEVENVDPASGSRKFYFDKKTTILGDE